MRIFIGLDKEVVSPGIKTFENVVRTGKLGHENGRKLGPGKIKCLFAVLSGEDLKAVTLEQRTQMFRLRRIVHSDQYHDVFRDKRADSGRHTAAPKLGRGPG